MSVQAKRKKKVVVLVIGLLMAYWVYPPGMMTVPRDTLTLLQIIRGAACVVIFFWTITFAVNIPD